MKREGLHMLETFGALIMVGSGLLALIGIPIALIACRAFALGERARPPIFYFKILAVPALLLGVFIPTFVVRSLLTDYAC